MNILIGYDRCSTCKKAEDFLKAEGVSFQKRPIKEEKKPREKQQNKKSRNRIGRIVCDFPITISIFILVGIPLHL